MKTCTVKSNSQVKKNSRACKKCRGDEGKVWKWWKEKKKIKKSDGVKWNTLRHRGPLFPPPYEPLPKCVKFLYKGKPMKLSKEAEEVACFYAKMLEEKLASKPVFKKNFFDSWRETMKPSEQTKIIDLSHCDFKNINEYFMKQSELKKKLPAERKLILKKHEDKLMMKYGYCLVDGHIQKIGNFKIEPPGLFRGRGNHPKMGVLKKRVKPYDVTINLAKGVPVPKPHCGGKWKEVIHDNTVTWLASWRDNITNSTKYMRLNQTSKITGESDLNKYELARMLENHLERIRGEYFEDMRSECNLLRQKAVALYFIDQLALRVGNEKKEDTADTVGCCLLRVEHIELYSSGSKKCVKLDFMGKDSVHYENVAVVPKLVWDNLKSFTKGKSPDCRLFDNLSASELNSYLSQMMPGLTAKVFRTHHASEMFEFSLGQHMKENMTVEEKLHVYRCANRDVAILCNHCREVPKNFPEVVRKLKKKIKEKTKQIKILSQEVKNAEIGSSKFQQKSSALSRAESQLKKMMLQAVEKVENKNLSLSTSRLNYIDPRITVAWCKRWNVPIEKIFNKSLREKFQWAIETAGPSFRF